TARIGVVDVSVRPARLAPSPSARVLVRNFGWRARTRARRSFSTAGLARMATTRLRRQVHPVAEKQPDLFSQRHRLAEVLPERAARASRTVHPEATPSRPAVWLALDPAPAVG